MREYKIATRSQERNELTQESKDKSFQDYNWKELYDSGNLRKFTKFELEKDIRHYRLLTIDKSTLKIKMLKKIEKTSCLLDEYMQNENPVNAES